MFPTIQSYQLRENTFPLYRIQYTCTYPLFATIMSNSLQLTWLCTWSVCILRGRFTMLLLNCGLLAPSTNWSVAPEFTNFGTYIIIWDGNIYTQCGTEYSWARSLLYQPLINSIVLRVRSVYCDLSTYAIASNANWFKVAGKWSNTSW